MTVETAGDGAAPVVRVEFSLRDQSYPFTGLTEELSCTFELAEMVPRSEDRYAEFFNVTGVDPARIAAIGGERSGVEITLLAEYDEGGLFEFLVTDDCPAGRLAEHGALPRKVRGEDGTGRIVAEIPAQYDPATVVDAFLEEHPSAELASKVHRESATPLFSGDAFQEVLFGHLTDRQREILETAFEAGYYEWPRRATGAEVAAELDITSATFSEHVHAAERNLLGAIFEDRSAGGRDQS
jgi:hypothetical protein